MGGRWTDRGVGGWAEALYDVKNTSAALSENPKKETSQESCDRGSIAFMDYFSIKPCNSRAHSPVRLA